MSIISHYQARFDATQLEEMSLEEYLELSKDAPSAYATAAERMLMAIGEPEMVDTAQDPRLSRIFSNKIIRRYPAFDEFYGLEEVIEHIVSYYRHAAQGLEEKKQILYLLGPVGGGKSSLAEKLKALMQKVPFYALTGSPVNDSPLTLVNPEEDGPILEEEYGIPRRYIRTIMSPWAVKRLHEFGGDHRSWEPQIRFFSRRYRCITYGARGYPPSEVPEDVTRYSQQRAVIDAINVLDALDISGAHIVGLSMG